MKILSKKNIDNAIRITKKYYNSSDRDLIKAMHSYKKDIEIESNWYIADLVSDLGKCASGQDITYQQIYDCLKILGYEVQ